MYFMNCVTNTALALTFLWLLKHLKIPFLFIMCNLALIANDYGVSDLTFQSFVPGSLLLQSPSFRESCRGEAVLCLAIFVLSNRNK